MKKSIIILSLFLLILISACSIDQQQDKYTFGNLSLIGEPYRKPLSTKIQMVNNCGPGGDVLTNNPSRTAFSSDAVHWEVNGEMGVGFVIGKGPLPIGLDLSIVPGLTIAHDWGQGVEYGDGWQLTAKENESVQYTLEYFEIWQHAKLDIIDIEGLVVTKVDIDYRVGFESTVVKKELISCSVADSYNATQAVLSNESTQSLLQNSEEVITDTPSPQKIIATSTPNSLRIVLPTNTENSVICRNGEFAPIDSTSLAPFSIVLNENEFVYGQCTQFNGYSININGGVAYILKGPGAFNWSTMHGWWNVCSGGNVQDIQDKLDWQANSLEENGNTASGIARRVICEESNGTLVCNQQ